MDNLIFGYPHSNYSEVNLDYIIKLVRENAGLHLEISGNQLLLKTLDGTTVSTVTVHYAEEAGHADTATTANTASFANTASTASTATTATEASHALTADNATTAGTATTANSATTAGTATEAVHATTADTAISANTATTATTASYAETTGHVEHADKAIETITISGNTVIFKTYDGTEYTVTMPYAVKALKDSLGNDIKSTYVANVVEDGGIIKFKDAEGNDITSLTPTSVSATNDSYNNLIADFIKAITVSSDSNYVTISHGTGTADTVIIHYSETALKDTNGNVIKNTYIKSLVFEEDSNTGHYNLIAYNGDNPSAEIFRTEVIAYRAQEADHATTADSATNADYATNAGSATNAAVAEKSEDSAYFIDCYNNHDGDYSVANPDTITIEHVYDNNGNEVDLASITADTYHNVYFRLRPSENSSEVYTYTVDTSYKVGSPNSPVFFKARIIDDISRSSGIDSITYINIEVGILNGSVATSKLFTYTEDMTSTIINVELKDADTPPLSLTVGQDFDYESDIDASAIFAKLNYGEFMMFHMVDEDQFNQGSAIINGTGGPAVIMLYENGVGPAYFRLGNNTTYTTGINLYRLS